MQLSHTVSAGSVAFDDPNLVGSAGLVLVLALARRCGLHDAAAALTVPNPNAALKTAERRAEDRRGGCGDGGRG